MSEPQQFLTVEEVCWKLRCSESQLLRLLKDGSLYSIQLPYGGGRRRRKLAYLRILWPPDAILDYIQQSLQPIDYFPLLSMPEAAEIMGITMNTIRSYICDGLVKTTKRGKYSFISPMEVRRYLYYAERRRRKYWGSKSIKILRLVEWFKTVYQREETLEDPIDDALNAIMKLPEPARTEEMMALLDHVEQLSASTSSSASGPLPASCTDTSPP